MTPRQQALAYRIYCHCAPIGWNCTMAEAARALGASLGAVRMAVIAKGWTHRLRRTVRHSDFENDSRISRTALHEVAELPRFEVAE
jgi:hypothetical protein